MTLDQHFWNQRYLDQNMGWDMGQASPPLVSVIDAINNKDSTILIPGCGNAYEAQYLLDKGFTNITLIDIAPELVNQLSQRFQDREEIQVLCLDFFEHKGQYDYIIEQTFFCALDPNLRPKYVRKMHELLAPGGQLAGVMFNVLFEREGPPFGGTSSEYQTLFAELFDVLIQPSENSIPQRRGTEIEVQFTKK